MPNVTSVPGDCISRLAKSQGFHNYRTVYDHDDNATSFPNPNCVTEGSTVKIPEKAMKAFDVTLDAEKTFKIVRKKTKATITICKADVAQSPVITKGKLVVGGKNAVGTTNTFTIDDIDPLVTTATLTIELANPAAYAAAPAPTAGVANQYPPPILADEYDDPKTVWPKKGETITWTLNVGYLEPHTVTRGVLQRLENLGFTCPIQQAEDDKTQRAVRTYRRAVEAKVPPADTTAVADIAAHIKARHDD